MDNRALFKIGYGLYVLSAQEEGRDNACIINTASQVTSTPCRITIAVNKMNRTNRMIHETGVFNLSILSQKASFETFRLFGFQSGAQTDKFAGRSDPRSKNRLTYITEGTNAYISGKVISEIDLGTHTLFLADVTEAEILSEENSATYDYYQRFIKPASPAPQTKKKGWRCRICGYIHEGEELPPDFICPICKHGAVDFERIE